MSPNHLFRLLLSGAFLLLASACSMPYGGTAAVKSFPPGVELDANAPPPPAVPPEAEDAVEDLRDLVDEKMSTITACLRYPTEAEQCACLRLNRHTDEVYRAVGCPVSKPPAATHSAVNPFPQGGGGEAPDDALRTELADARADAAHTLDAMTEQLKRADRLSDLLERARQGCRANKAVANHEVIGTVSYNAVLCDDDALSVLKGDG